MMKNKAFVMGGQKIKPGTQAVVLYPTPSINTQIQMEIPAHVLHGKYAGPKLFITATIHGDEINSIEIIRRVRQLIALDKLHGTVLMVPVANVYGLMAQSRYLPDRRDLNRCFPGTKKGTIATRLAYGIMKEVVKQCQYGIDLHTGGLGRINMPQLRVNLATPGAKELALAFTSAVVIDAKIRDGSLRQAASEIGIPVLVYEGGEALRYNEISIRAGVRGIMNVLDYLGMQALSEKRVANTEAVIATGTHWLRAHAGGLVQPLQNMIAKPVKKNEILAYIHDPFMIRPSTPIKSPYDGLVIGEALKPIVSEGDPIYNIATFGEIDGLSSSIEEYRDEFMD
jgi:predicted deacylase